MIDDGDDDGDDGDDDGDDDDDDDDCFSPPSSLHPLPPSIAASPSLRFATF